MRDKRSKRERNGNGMKENWINNNGYVMTYRPDHQRAGKAGYVAEHVVAVEEKLGRLLKSEEHVHHINRVKTNNHPDNLMVLSSSEHSKLHGLESKTRGAARKEKNKNRKLKEKYFYIRGIGFSKEVEDYGKNKRNKIPV